MGAYLILTTLGGNASIIPTLQTKQRIEVKGHAYIHWASQQGRTPAQKRASEIGSCGLHARHKLSRLLESAWHCDECLLSILSLNSHNNPMIIIKGTEIKRAHFRARGA